jgi:hypothetical protein
MISSKNFLIIIMMMIIIDILLVNQHHVVFFHARPFFLLLFFSFFIALLMRLTLVDYIVHRAVSCYFLEIIAAKGPHYAFNSSDSICKFISTLKYKNSEGQDSLSK